jgi:hypothetical protein
MVNMKEIKTIKANSAEGGEVYRLLNLVHQMAGSLANSPRKEFQLAATNSDEMYGPILTVWTNGIVDIEARTWRDREPAYHEYTMRAVAREDAQ